MGGVASIFAIVFGVEGIRAAAELEGRQRSLSIIGIIAAVIRLGIQTIIFMFIGMQYRVLLSLIRSDLILLIMIRLFHK
jgi:hypothetical protein